jgi:hypothetical protein
MQSDISQSDSQLTVHLIEPATMTWAVVRENERIHEGSFQSCEAFLDWHENVHRLRFSHASSVDSKEDELC